MKIPDVKCWTLRKEKGIAVAIEYGNVTILELDKYSQRNEKWADTIVRLLTGQDTIALAIFAESKGLKIDN